MMTRVWSEAVLGVVTLDFGLPVFTAPSSGAVASGFSSSAGPSLFPRRPAPTSSSDRLRRADRRLPGLKSYGVQR
jgi:hypothetical protein